MFDWNDEELTDIIWDEAGERDGSIDTCPEQIEHKPPILFVDTTKKETDQDTAYVSPVERKKTHAKSELDSNSKYDHVEHETGFSLASWPNELNPSLSDTAKADPDSTETAESKNLTTILKNGSLTSDEAIQLDKDTEIFQNPPEDREQGDFVDYGWANIGSFDDLDRIFSHNDPIFGDMSAGDADELWSSSRDVTDSPPCPALFHGDSSDLAFRPLKTSTDRSSEIKSQYMPDPGQSLFSGYGKPNEISSEDVQAFVTSGKIQACHKQLGEGTAATIAEFPNELFSCVQGNKPKILPKGQKLDKNSELQELHDLFGTWSSSENLFQQVRTPYASSFVNPCPPLGSLQENHFAGQLLTKSTYGKPELLSSGYEVPLGKVNSLKMTPEEKIEKLRRRQQMRAILAIQKQHQHFSNQVAVAERSTMDGGTVEVDNNLSMNSPIDYDVSNTLSMVFDSCSLEEAVLYQLKDTIAKLELQIRLCIRDSLFRLAKSAMQRQYSSDTCSTNASSRDEVLGNKDIHNRKRFTGMPDVETDTNPIDRTVAHLLFYRPLEFSGKPTEMPESPISANLPYEKEANSLKGLAHDFFAASFENTQTTSPPGSKAPALYSEGDQSKKSICLGTSGNASNNEAADEGTTKNEASK